MPLMFRENAEKDKEVVLGEKTASKIMALLQYCLMMVMFIAVEANATGIINYQTVLLTEKQQTLAMLQQAEKETDDEISLLKKELETSKACGVERLKTIVSLVVMTRYSLLEREALLKRLRDTKGILETKSIRKKEDRK